MKLSSGQIQSSKPPDAIQRRWDLSRARHFNVCRGAGETPSCDKDRCGDTAKDRCDTERSLKAKEKQRLKSMLAIMLPSSCASLNDL